MSWAQAGRTLALTCRRRPLLASAAALLLTAGVVLAVSVYLANEQKRHAEIAALFASDEAEIALGAAYARQIAKSNTEIEQGLQEAGPSLELTSPESRGWEYHYLRRQLEGTPLTFRGHSGPVHAAAFSPDGVRLASASADGIIKVWNVETGAVVWTASSQGVAVQALAYSPDGGKLAAASRDNSIKLLNAVTGLEIHSLRGHSMPVKGIAYSPDGSRLASASLDQTVKIWDPETGREVMTLRGHSAGINAPAFSPDGALLASASDDKCAKVWEVRTGKEMLHLQGHVGAVKSVSFSPDGTQLATASADRIIKLWTAASGQELRALRGHSAPEISTQLGRPRRTVQRVLQSVKHWLESQQAEGASEA